MVEVCEACAKPDRIGRPVTAWLVEGNAEAMLCGGCVRELREWGSDVERLGDAK